MNLSTREDLRQDHDWASQLRELFSCLQKNDEEEKWHQPERHPATDEEKKKITAIAVITAVEAVMANHVYNFDNAWGKQNDGGGISNLLTGEVAKVVMAW